MSRSDSGEAGSGGGPGRRFFFWWADRPGWQGVVVVVITAAAIVGYVRPELVRNRFVTESPGNIPSQVAPATAEEVGTPPPPTVEPFQIGGGDVVLVATSDDFFTPAGVNAIRRVVERLEQLPQVAEVLWLDEVPGLNLFGLPESLLPRATASPRQMRDARRRALAHPLAVGQLISDDGKTLVLHVRLDWFYATSDEAATSQLREAAERAAAEPDSGEGGAADVQFMATGRVPLHLMTVENHIQNAWRYQIIGYGIMLISALVLFRGFAAVAIVAIAPALGVFWTMGWLHFFDLQDNPFNDIIVPVLISLVGLTDSVHLMVEIRNQRAVGRNGLAASRHGLARVGVACVLTSVTTGIGFICLAWAHHEIVRQFGWCCVLGVVMTLISVLTVIPLGCRSPLGRRLHEGLGKSPIDRHLQRIDSLVGWILRHDRAVSYAAIVSTILLVACSATLTPDERRYSGLSETDEAARGLRHLDRELGGLEFGHVRIRWQPAAGDGELLDVLREADDALKAEPLIGHPLGVHQLLSALPGAEAEPTADRVAMLDLLPPPLKRAFYSPEQHFATIQFRVQDIGIARYGPVFERIEAELAEVAARHPEFQLELSGEAVWRWRHIYRVVSDLAASLGTAILVIWLVLTLAYRSLRIGLISIIPNVFPLAVTGSVLVLSGQHLEMVTVCVFTICIGIAVDDTIHFLTRYREEASAGGLPEQVIRRAFTGVGTALLMTTVVLVAGMGTAILGDARDAQLFGIMGSLTLVAALFADLLLLPALLNRYGPRS